MGHIITSLKFTSIELFKDYKTIYFDILKCQTTGSDKQLKKIIEKFETFKIQHVRLFVLLRPIFDKLKIRHDINFYYFHFTYFP